MFKDFEPKGYIPQVKTSGFEEIQKCGRELVQSPDDLSGKKVIFCDGCTTMANLRSIEVVTTTIAANKLSPHADSVHVEVCSGGYAEFAYKDLGLSEEHLVPIEEKMARLKELYPAVIFDSKTNRFLPPSAFFVPAVGRDLPSTLVAARKELIQTCGDALGINTDKVVVGTFELEPYVKDKKVEDLFHGHNGTSLKFICPECSRLQQEAVEHSLLSSGQVIKTQGGRKMRCRGASGIQQEMATGKFQEMSLPEAVGLGFYFSGSTTYDLLISGVDQDRHSLLVRNYSNARGTVAGIGNKWTGQMGITKRYYFEDKVEIPGVLLPSVLESSPNLQDSIRQDSLLVVSPEEDIFLPIR